MLRDNAIQIMSQYYQNDSRQVGHSIKVLEEAEKIYHNEYLKDSFMFNVVVLSSIFHDIGIPEAKRKHGSSAPKYQEMEGPSVARSLMAKLDIRSDILERVCYIVGNHHTYENIDGLDFQILFEADMIVNLQEGWTGLDRSELRSRVEKSSFTSSGKAVILNLL